MQVAGKVWGITRAIFANPGFELHRLMIRAPHRCSKHRHRSKYNGFFVEAGSIKVTVWQENGTVDTTELEEGETLIVPPGLFHQFTGLSSQAVVYEWYWAGLEPDDIEREDVGE